MTVPSDHSKIKNNSENNAYKIVGQSLSKIRVFSKSSQLSFSFTFRALSSLKISVKTFKADFENNAFEV